MAKNRKPIFSKNDYEKICRLVAEGESDRGAALVGSALLEDLLSELLTAYFVDDANQAASMLGLTGDGPIGTFSAKIKLTYLLGIIGKDIRDDLDRIRNIRNRFAHSRDPLSFQDGEVKSWCGNLIAPAILNKISIEQKTIERPIKKPRDLFVITFSSLLHVIMEEINIIKHRKLREDYQFLSGIASTPGEHGTESKGGYSISVWLTSVEFVDDKKNPL